MKRFLIAALLLATSLSYAQLGTTTQIRRGGTLPSSCGGGDVFIKTGTSAGLYYNLVGGSCSWIGPLTTSVAALADPGSNGIVKRTALNTTASAVLSDILGYFTGTPTGSKFLRDDGAWDTPSGGSAFATIIAPSGDTTGSTDTAAINNAISAGTSVRLINGDYYVSTINVGSPASIIGNGPGRTFINQTSTTADTFTITYPVTLPSTSAITVGATIRGFTVRPKSGVTQTAGCVFNIGTGSAGTYVVGLHLENIHGTKLWNGICTGTGMISNWLKDLYFANMLNLGILYNSPIPSGDNHFDNVEMVGTSTGVQIAQGDSTQFTNLKVNLAKVVFTRGATAQNIRFINPSVEGDFSTSTCGFDFGSGSNTPDTVEIMGGHVNGVVTPLCNSANTTNLMYAITAKQIGASYTATSVLSNIPSGGLTPTVAISTTGTITPTLVAPPQSGRYYRNGSSVVYSLPSIGTAGYGACIANYPGVSSSITVTPPSNTSIAVNGVNGATGQGVSTAGSVLDRACFTAATTTQYIADEISGTWNFVGVFDSFTGTNGTAITSHTSDTGQSWAYTPTTFNSSNSGTIALNGSGLVYDTSGSTTNYVGALSSYAPSSADYKVSASFKMSNSTTQAILYGRANTSTNNAYFCVWDSGAGGVQLYRLLSGTGSTIGSLTSLSWPNGSTHTMALVMTGTSISCQADGTTVSSATDSTITAAGSAGFRLAGASSTGMGSFAVQ